MMGSACMFSLLHILPGCQSACLSAGACLTVCRFLCHSIWLSTSLHVWLSILLSFYPHILSAYTVYMTTSFPVCMHLFVFVIFSMSCIVYLSGWLICLSVRFLTVCLSVCLSGCLTLSLHFPDCLYLPCLFVCLSVSLPVCLRIVRLSFIYH